MTLTFEKDALLEIAKKANKRKTGARGLRSIMEDVLMQAMYDTPSEHTIDTIIVTKAAVLGTGKLKLTYDTHKKPVNIPIAKSPNQQRGNPKKNLA